MAMDSFLYFPSAAKAAAGDIQVKGESQDPEYTGKNAIELQEFSFGMENSTTIGSATSGAGAGKAKFDDFTIQKTVDSATPSLLSACGSGANFPSMVLEVRKAGGTSGGKPQAYLQYTFQTVFVTKIDWSGGPGTDAPMESVTFAYGAMKVQYSPQSATGALGNPQSAAWSQLTNSPNVQLAATA